MRKTAAVHPVAATDTRPVAPPVTGPPSRSPCSSPTMKMAPCAPKSARIPLPSGRQQRAEELLRALVTLYLDKSSTHAIPAGAEIRSVFLVDPGVAVIDLNSSFADSHRSGILVEELTVASLIHTISTNIPGILRVKILVNGKERDTLAGHADLSDVLRRLRRQPARRPVAVKSLQWSRSLCASIGTMSGSAACTQT